MKNQNKKQTMNNAIAQNPPVPSEPPQPTVEQQLKHDHWFVQVVGGITLANTVVSAMAMLWIFMEFGLVA